MDYPEILERMRADWNERAREDANYYVAFGRRGQDAEEFFATAADVVRSLEAELKRFPSRGNLTALEIGCGPGRLMRPMSRHFVEIHGVDVSDEMVRLARANLSGVSHAHVHRTTGSELAQFEDGSFDFVYSYAVFQHIPSREVVFGYLREARRVLRESGILRCQINSLPETAARYSTWNGVRIPAREVAAFARDHDFQLLSLEGVSTQYLWTTWRKRHDGWERSLAGCNRQPQALIRNVGNAQTGEPAIPATGPFAAASLSIEGLPEDCDLNHLEVRMDGLVCTPAYIGPPQWDGVSQVNVALPDGLRTGMVPVEIDWLGKPLCASMWARVVPAGPAVPWVCSLADGVNLLSGRRIVSGIVKVTVEEVVQPEMFGATVGGNPVENIDFFCTDPLTRRYEINFSIPRGTPPGPHQIEMWLGKRRFAPVSIEVA